MLRKKVIRSNGLSEQQIARLDRSSDKNWSKKWLKNHSKTKKKKNKIMYSTRIQKKRRAVLHYGVPDQTEWFRLSYVLIWNFGLRSESEFFSKTKDKTVSVIIPYLLYKSSLAC